MSLRPEEAIEIILHSDAFELRKYSGILGVAYVEDLKTGEKKFLSHAFAKYLEDKGRVRIVATAPTLRELEAKVK